VEPPSTGFLFKIFVHNWYSSIYFCYVTIMPISKYIKYIVHARGISLRMISYCGFGLHLTGPVNETGRCCPESFKLFAVCHDYKFTLKIEVY